MEKNERNNERCSFCVRFHSPHCKWNATYIVPIFNELSIVFHPLTSTNNNQILNDVLHVLTFRFYISFFDTTWNELLEFSKFIFYWHWVKYGSNELTTLCLVYGRTVGQRKFLEQKKMYDREHFSGKKEWTDGRNFFP